jgi:transposase InsO family protein
VDCSKEAIRIAADTSMPALYVTRLLNQARAERDLHKVIRTDNGPEFAGRTMQSWAAANDVELRFIQLAKPVQIAYIESFNNRLCDECLSQHWFARLSHMRSVIDAWRDDYNHHWPHSALGYPYAASGVRTARRDPARERGADRPPPSRLCTRGRWSVVQTFLGLARCARTMRRRCGRYWTVPTQ